MKEASDKRREARIAERAFGSPPKSTYIQQPPPKQKDTSSEPSDVWERAVQLTVMIVAGILVVAFMSRPSSSGSGSYSGARQSRNDGGFNSPGRQSYETPVYQLKDGPIYNADNYIPPARAERYFGADAQAEARELLQQHDTPNPSRQEIESVLRLNEAFENPINKADPKNYVP